MIKASRFCLVVSVILLIIAGAIGEHFGLAVQMLVGVCIAAVLAFTMFFVWGIMSEVQDLRKELEELKKNLPPD